MADYQKLNHGFGPYFDVESRILVLGSFPSIKSREQNFFYGHPKNRFWPLLANIFGCDLPRSIDEKKQLLYRTHVACYDVIESCEIINSSDASIKNPVVSDLPAILGHTNVTTILLNGKKAGALFEKYQLPLLGNKYRYAILPSTSPANAAVSFEKLCEEWRVFLLE